MFHIGWRDLPSLFWFVLTHKKPTPKTRACPLCLGLGTVNR